MTSCTPESGRRCSERASLMRDYIDFSEAAPTRSFRKRNEAGAAKSVIETTLLKSAGILSEFTENTLSQTSMYFNNILSPERFGFSFNSIPTNQNQLKAPTPAANNANPSHQNVVAGRRTLDITKLPSSIVNILRQDSNSSIPSMQKSKKYHYHSKKLALKQRDDSSKEKVLAPLTKSYEVIAPKIVVVSTPLTLQQNFSNSLDTLQPPGKQVLDKVYMNNKVALNSKISHDTYIHTESSTTKSTPMQYHVVSAAIMKNEKRIGATAHASSVVKKPEKINIGVGNGIAFILGPKARTYFNTFGCEDFESTRDAGSDIAASNRKWVVNVGNFLDNEISLALIGNNLTITGFRQPSLTYPEGQTVSESIPLPQEFDVRKLRIYRAKNAKSFLIIQEKK